MLLTLKSFPTLTIASWTLLVACSTPLQQDIDTELLLSGKALFGSEVNPQFDHDKDILAIDDTMRNWVEDAVGDIAYPGARLRQLVQALIDDGYLNLEYNNTVTNTAIETFYSKAGNCLSFSNLFVALAREAGLDASFQLVEIPPSFTASEQFVILNNHINVLVTDYSRGPNFNVRRVVDFNTAEFSGNYDTRKVSDDYVRALFQSNLAVSKLQAGNSLAAFQHLRHGIEINDRIPELWVNLGVMYSRHDRFELAIQSYNQALQLQANHKSALSNLAEVYRFTGKTELAELTQQRIDAYQNRNPYYQYFMAQQAFDNNNNNDALDRLARAIRLKRNEHQFFYLRGLIQLQQGQIDEAEMSFQQASKVAERPEIIRAYEAKLESLQAATRL